MERGRSLLADSSPAWWSSSGGGYRRTSQLHEILTNAGIEILPVSRDSACSNLLKYALGFKFLLRTGLSQRCSLRLIRHHGAAVARWEAVFLRHRGGNVVLWEDTHRNNQAIPYLARRFGYTVLAAPHNLENLVPREVHRAAEITASRVAEEIRFLRAAKAVVCISREEQWWLALHGITTDFLPYYPPRRIAAYFGSIRERRQSVPQTRWLILGSAAYAPNYSGMTRLIETLKGLPNGGVLPVDIAGYQTEILKPLIAGTSYELHGEVDQPTLASLLAKAKATLVSQTAGAGALTRIPEMLLAGVPVIATPVAARSATHYPGVQVYASGQELFRLLQADPPRVPLLAQPADAEQRFLETLEQLVSGGSLLSPQARVG
jgi:hypothetical protein